MASSVIDLAKFVRGDVEKARRRKPDSGLTVSGWNATPEGRDHPKDARGRWTDNPVGQAIAEAYSRVQGTYGSEWASLADIREEINGRFTRAEVDAELKRLSRAGAINLVPESNQKTLTERQRAAATHLGGEEQHVISFMGDLPEPKRSNEERSLAQQIRFTASSDERLRLMEGLTMAQLRAVADEIGVPIKPGTKKEDVKSRINVMMGAYGPTVTSSLFPGSSGEDSSSFIEEGALSLDFNPFDENRVRANRRDFIASLHDTASLGEWDDGELQRAQAAAMEFSRAAEMELIRRKGAELNPPKKPRVTARLTAKPKPDYSAIAARMRAAQSIEEADAHLEGLTVAGLKDLARELGISPGSARKADLRRRLVDHTVGFKLDADAIARMDTNARLGRHRAPDANFVDMTRARILTRADVTPEEVEAAMEGMTVAQLKALAAELGPTVLARGTKEQIKQAIREGTYGFRDRAAAIGGWGRR